MLKQVRDGNIRYYITETNLYQQSPTEGVIREVRRKWYRVIIKKVFQLDFGNTE